MSVLKISSKSFGCRVKSNFMLISLSLINVGPWENYMTSSNFGILIFKILVDEVTSVVPLISSLHDGFSL